MLSKLANDFNQISEILAQNEKLRTSIIELIQSSLISGKVTEEDHRLAKFKELLTAYVNGNYSLAELYLQVEKDVPKENSIYSTNNRVFPNGWAERHVRTQVSRFYNQAILEEMIRQGHEECFVPHSTSEDGGSDCSLHLAGKNHNVRVLYDRLVNSYSLGNFDKELKIPHHPHCTHVITLKVL